MLRDYIDICRFQLNNHARRLHRYMLGDYIDICYEITEIYARRLHRYMLGDYIDICDPQLRTITEYETIQYQYSPQHITFSRGCQFCML